MPEHYPRNTKLVMSWCNVCRGNTMHRVDEKRLGSCTEHQADQYSKDQLKRQAAQEQENQQPKLF
jgi:ribosomal protein L44E